MTNGSKMVFIILFQKEKKLGDFSFCLTKLEPKDLESSVCATLHHVSTTKTPL